MEYHEFLAYLFDRAETREWARVFAQVVASRDAQAALLGD